MSSTKSDPSVDNHCGSDFSDDEEDDDLFEKIRHDINQEVNKSETKSKGSKRVSKKGKKRQNSVICDECRPQRHFKKKKVLEQHKQVMHIDAQPIVCLWCAKQFFSDNQLKVHQKLYFHDKSID